MSEYRIQLEWKRNTPDFDYESFERAHQIRFSGGAGLGASSAPEFKGDAKLANPEELLAAAVSSCHFLTFLAIAAKSRLTVDRYEDEAVAMLEKNSEGVMMVTKIYLRPKVVFGGDKLPEKDEIKILHKKAHKYCFIANSILSEVVVEDIE